MTRDIRVAAVVLTLMTAAGAAGLRRRPAVLAGAPPQTLRAPVDLNHARAEELMALPGIGAERARRIVRRRDELGGFRSLEDLLQVSGLGERTLERLRPHVTLGPAPR